MKKQYLFGFIVIILAFALAFAGCDFGVEGGGGGGGGNQDNPKDTYDPITVLTKDKNGIDVKTIFTRSATRAAIPWTLATGDGYQIFQGTPEISKGTIRLTGTIITFVPTGAGSSFEANMIGSGDSRVLNFAEGIPATATSGKIEFSPISGVINPEFSVNLSDAEIPLALNSSVSTPLSVILKDDSGGSRSYQWFSGTSSGSGTAIANATGTSHTPLTTQQGTVYYYVCITNTSGGLAKSNSAKVTVTGVTSNPPPGSLGIDGGDTFSNSGNTTLIFGKAVVNGNYQISNTVRVMGTPGSVGTLTIPSTATVTVNSGGRLIIDGGGALIANGTLVVASGGLFDISANGLNTGVSAGQNGTLSGNGLITIGGAMYLPHLSVYDLSSASGGRIEVKTAGELFLGTYNNSAMEYNPLIGKSSSPVRKYTGGTFVDSNSTAASNFIVGDGGSIILTKNASNSFFTNMYLSGPATVMGLPINGTNTVTINSKLNISPNSKLTIGGTGSKPSHLIIDTDGSIDIGNNSTVAVTTGSLIRGPLSAVTGPGVNNITKDDGITKITYTSGTGGNVEWRN
jgi:hypothetical protein